MYGFNERKLIKCHISQTVLVMHLSMLGRRGGGGGGGGGGGARGRDLTFKQNFVSNSLPQGFKCWSNRSYPGAIKTVSSKRFLKLNNS